MFHGLNRGKSLGWRNLAQKDGFWDELLDGHPESDKLFI